MGILGDWAWLGKVLQSQSSGESQLSRGPRARPDCQLRHQRHGSCWWKVKEMLGAEGGGQQARGRGTQWGLLLAHTSPVSGGQEPVAGRNL